MHPTMKFFRFFRTISAKVDSRLPELEYTSFERSSRGLLLRDLEIKRAVPPTDVTAGVSNDLKPGMESSVFSIEE